MSPDESAEPATTTSVGRSGRVSGQVWALGAVALWSTSSLTIVLSRDVPASALLLTTHAIGAIGLSAWAAIRRGPRSAIEPVTRLSVGFVAIALLGTLVYQTCYVNGLRLAPAGEANLLNYLWPLFTALFAVPLRREPLSRRLVLGMVAGFAGCALLVGGASGEEFPDRYLGYALAVGGAVAWGAYSNLIARLPGSSLEHQRVILAIGALAFVPALLLEGYSGLNLRAVPALAYLGLGPVALAAVCWQSAMSRGPVSRVAVAAYLTPLLSTLMLVAFGGQPIEWRLAAGLALVLTAAILPSSS
jgi:drug/metabolite transporter (DMT)-like permease